MKTEDIVIEEIYKKINIQSLLLDLQSKNSDLIGSALSTLATIANLTDRRDILYALAGYYSLEIKNIPDIKSFFKRVRESYSFDIYKLILKDISKDKNIYRQKLFIDDFINSFAVTLDNITEVEISEVKTIIKNCDWGEKLKHRFISKIERTYW